MIEDFEIINKKSLNKYRNFEIGKLVESQGGDLGLVISLQAITERVIRPKILPARTRVILQVLDTKSGMVRNLCASQLQVIS